MKRSTRANAKDFTAKVVAMLTEIEVRNGNDLSFDDFLSAFRDEINHAYPVLTCK